MIICNIALVTRLNSIDHWNLAPVSAFLATLSFNITNWIFSFSYYKSSVCTFNGQNEVRNKKKECCLDATFWLVLLANIISPFNELEWWVSGADTLFVILYFSVLLEQILSCIFLLLAILNIYSFFKKSGLSHRINQKKFVVHAVCLTLFSVSFTAYNIYNYAYYYTDNQKSFTSFRFYSAIGIFFLFLLAQIC